VVYELDRDGEQEICSLIPGKQSRLDPGRHSYRAHLNSLPARPNTRGTATRGGRRPARRRAGASRPADSAGLRHEVCSGRRDARPLRQAGRPPPQSHTGKKLRSAPSARHGSCCQINCSFFIRVGCGVVMAVAGTALRYYEAGLGWRRTAIARENLEWLIALTRPCGRFTEGIHG
jgi:hypothetical protein